MRILLVVAVALAASAVPAAAYIDPGSGSYLFQLAIAALLGGMFLLRRFWVRLFAGLRKFFRRRGRE
jgi:hypothetical protein